MNPLTWPRRLLTWLASLPHRLLLALVGLVVYLVARLLLAIGGPLAFLGAAGLIWACLSVPEMSAPVGMDVSWGATWSIRLVAAGIYLLLFGPLYILLIRRVARLLDPYRSAPAQRTEDDVRLDGLADKADERKAAAR